MAEIVLRETARRLQVLDIVEISSSGISDEEQGNPMDSRAVYALAKHGYASEEQTITNHRAKKLMPSDIKDVDLFLPMTNHHAQTLRKVYSIPNERIRLWRSFEVTAFRNVLGDKTADMINDGECPDLEDPWYGNQDDFDLTLCQLEVSAEMIIRTALTKYEDTGITPIRRSKVVTIKGNTVIDGIPLDDLNKLNGIFDDGANYG
jgi:protein-tyrosine phosphatase